MGKAQDQAGNAGEAPGSYLDIGHNAGSYVWLMDEGILIRFRNGTHEEVWGVRKSFTCWRGRYDPDTSQASIAAPENWIGGPPRRVVRKVAEAFHPATIWLFPWPPGAPPQLVTSKGTGRIPRKR